MCSAEARARITGHERVCPDVCQHGELRLKEGALDLAAHPGLVACNERSEDRAVGKETRRHIRHSDARLLAVGCSQAKGGGRGKKRWRQMNREVKRGTRSSSLSPSPSLSLSVRKS